MALRLRPISVAHVLVVAGLLSVAGAAHAAPTAADRETARTLMDQGRDLRDKGNVKEALKRFQAANDIMHVPTTALEVAHAQVVLGLLVEARDTIAALRQQAAGPKESQIFKDARAAAEQLDASLNARVPAVTISLKGPRAGPPPAGEEAELTIDGVSVPAAILGLPRSVDPGHHTVTAKTKTAEGKQEFDVREGEQKPVEVALVSTGVVAPVAEAAQPEAAPPPKSHMPSTLTWVGIGVAGAGVIVGSVTGGVSIGKKGTLASECPNHICGPSASSTLKSATTLATVSDISFAIAGAGAVVAVIGLFRGGRSSPPPAAGSGMHIMPWLAGSAGGVYGTF
jgi:hypothetical protein